MRRKRTRKYTWMPILGGLGTPAGASGENTSFFADELVPFANGTVAQYVTPIVPDETEQPDPALAGSQSLRDLTEGQDWFLKRIVGKLQIACSQSGADAFPTAWPNVIVGAAFFVARANDDNPNELDMTSDEVDPLNAFNTRQPWIWRRTWILSNLGQASGGATNVHYGPMDNSQFGSALDGPHIDAKTARRIRKEERLWFTISAIGFDRAPGAPVTVEFEYTTVSFTLDYRILGQMRKSTNRSTF